jgi:hypothetical protein
MYVIRSSDKAWVTPALKYQIKLRDNIFKKARRSKKVKDYVTFKAQRNRVVDMIRTAKRTYHDSIYEKIDDKNTSEKDWWKIVGSVMAYFLMTLIKLMH